MFQAMKYSGYLLMIIVCGMMCDVCVRGQVYPTDITVAHDGTGQYRKISDAIQAAPNNSLRRFYIKIKAGIYRETINIGPEKTRLTLVGDGMEKTRIINNKSVKGGFDKYHTATVGHQFVAIDISFENDAGPENMQAIALRSEVESAFYRCKFFGFQDTLNAQFRRQFYKNCDIYGTIDFIFGNAQVVLQESNIYVRKPLANQYNVITAQGRGVNGESGGTVIHRCKIIAAPDFKQYQNLFKTYLGRPWKTYSRVVIMLSNIDGLVDPKGWVEWNNQTQYDKLYYVEYHNRGPGGVTTNRVKWPGFKLLNSPKEAEPFTVRNFIQGNEWIPSTRVPFILDF